MKALAPLIAAAALGGGLAAPLAAQPYSQGDVQTQRVLGGIVDALIGNRYNVSDRQAIRRCSFAAVDQAENQYRPYFGNAPFAYAGYRGHVRVSAITDVNRKFGGVRVKGLLDTARYGYGNGPRGADLRFRCDVDNGGRVYNVRIERNPYWRR